MITFLSIISNYSFYEMPFENYIQCLIGLDEKLWMDNYNDRRKTIHFCWHIFDEISAGNSGKIGAQR